MLAQIIYLSRFRIHNMLNIGGELFPISALAFLNFIGYQLILYSSLCGYNFLYSYKEFHFALEPGFTVFSLFCFCLLLLQLLSLCLYLVLWEHLGYALHQWFCPQQVFSNNLFWVYFFFCTVLLFFTSTILWLFIMFVEVTWCFRCLYIFIANNVDLCPHEFAKLNFCYGLLV